MGIVKKRQDVINTALALQLGYKIRQCKQAYINGNLNTEFCKFPKQIGDELCRNLVRALGYLGVEATSNFWVSNSGIYYGATITFVSPL